MAYMKGNRVAFSQNINISNDVVEEYNNLLARNNIHQRGDTNFFKIGSYDAEPIPAGVYVCNIPHQLLYDAIAYVYDGEILIDEYHIDAIEAIDSGVKITLAEPVKELNVIYSNSVETLDIVFIEGETLPKRYKPYGKAEYVKDEYLDAVYSELSRKQPIPERSEPTTVNVVDTEYTILKTNHIHTLTVLSPVRFSLPALADNGDQILVLAIVGTGAEVVNWGTTNFFNEEVPSITEGRYNFIFEYDDGEWYAGAIRKGAVE